MKPPRSCCGVTGTRSTTTVSPTGSKTLNETKKKGTNSAWEEDVCCPQTHTALVLWAGGGFFAFYVLHVPANGSAPPVTLCAVFLMRGVVCEESSLRPVRETNNWAGKTSFLKLQLERMSWPGLRCTWCCNVIQLSQLDISWSFRRNDPLAAFGGSLTDSWLSV